MLLKSQADVFVRPPSKWSAGQFDLTDGLMRAVKPRRLRHVDVMTNKHANDATRGQKIQFEKRKKKWEESKIITAGDVQQSERSWHSGWAEQWGRWGDRVCAEIFFFLGEKRQKKVVTSYLQTWVWTCPCWRRTQPATCSPGPGRSLAEQPRDSPPVGKGECFIREKVTRLGSGELNSGCADGVRSAKGYFLEEGHTGQEANSSDPH